VRLRRRLGPLLRAVVGGERRLAVLVGAAVGLALLLSGLGASFEKLGSDLRSGFVARPASGEVAIVEIDARSIAAFGRWPWPRSVHGSIVDRLRQAGARLIAFDVDFSGRSDPKEDAVFAAALVRAGGTVMLPTFRQEAAFDTGGTVESAPIPPLADNAFLVSANVQPDRDGKLRRMPYAVAILGAPRPSLSAMIAEHPGKASDSFAVDVHIDPQTLPRYSAIDVVAGRVPPSAFTGKRVIIGGTAVELGDRYSVPGFDLLPGVVVQAMAAETLLGGRAFPEISAGWPLLLALLLLGIALTPRRHALHPPCIAAACIVLLFLPSASERFAATTVAVVPALGALLCGAIAAAAHVFAGRYRERGLTDRETGLPNLAALVGDAEAEERLTIGALRIGRVAERVSSGGGAKVRARILRLADQLGFATGAERVYRSGPDTLVWRMAEPSPGEDSLAGIAHLLRAAAASEEGGELQLHFGIASGAACEAAAVVASAALAAERAAATGVTSREFTAADADLMRRDEALLSRFEAALAERRIHGVYQLKRDLRSGRAKGVEALARWQDPELGAIRPDIFVALLERYGGILELTVAMLGDALEAVKVWNAISPGFTVAVNLSALLLHDAAAMLRLRQIFLDSAVPAECLVIEVTETAAMSDPAGAIAALDAWRSLGVGVSIDDYGTGHSSLAYLHSLPASELKIDGSFVRDLATDSRSAIMVRSTVSMAHELGLEVVAEGVEDAATLDLLRAIGCDVAQGWAIGRPVPAEDIAAFLAAEAKASRRAG